MRQFDLERIGDGLEELARTERSEGLTLVLHPGQFCEPEPAPTDQWLLVLSGRGVATVNGRELALRGGTLLLIERGEFNELRASGKGPLLLFQFQSREARP
ncbi:cupin domain-containing protein [Alkalilimnicola sp. S0819]|uniref:cupin domain-containing protein n=1 Tax=Alkalilimnicola sp. S0819 TaxID=2613922 RepID=UPI00186A9C40|nr:cupin domain-containing protein [Alkalilimnicola sp. S0819]